VKTAHVCAQLLWYTFRVQSIQDAARLVPGAQHHDHIMPILWQLHWLPVRQPVQFKVAVLVFQCLCSMRRLRSTDTAMCAVQRSHNTFGDRCLAMAVKSVTF